MAAKRLRFLSLIVLPNFYINISLQRVLVLPLLINWIKYDFSAGDSVLPLKGIFLSLHMMMTYYNCANSQIQVGLKLSHIHVAVIVPAQSTISGSEIGCRSVRDNYELESMISCL